MRKVIIYLAIKYQGDWQDIYNAIKRKEKPDSDFEEIINKVNDNVITILDKDYPKVFSSLLRPPFVIFYKGDISLLSKNIISVVGSRNPPSYAINSLKEVIKDINKDIVICSGLARGIDTVSLGEALKNELKTIVYLPCGIEDCYPKENLSLLNKIIENGLVISEYPHCTKMERNNFYMRNRLIAASCQKLVVGHVNKKSGTMITFNYALEMGKDIYCIPSRIGDDSFGNQLIKDGADILIDGKDLNY